MGSVDQEFQPLETFEDRRGNGIGVAVSLLAHFGLLTLAWIRYAEPIAVPEPPVRYVQLVTAPRTFVEAPGQKTDQASPDALFSDANRQARAPNPSGVNPATRPGLQEGLYVPGAAGPPAAEAAMTASPPQAQAQPDGSSDDSFQYRVGSESTPLPPAGAAGIDWRSAIKEVGKVASLGGELGNFAGEQGFAESGPISFETQWYDWGEYAQGMVARIRRHWYDNMPAVVRLGLKGAVTIRFTIERSGAITEIEMLTSSGIPPFDHAARKAIQLASPLAPLPADFPNSRERVTAQFFYNRRP
jgi:TonB family protein